MRKKKITAQLLLFPPLRKAIKTQKPRPSKDAEA
jgi:hypothetical protein